jgi:hypothetical protein
MERISSPSRWICEHAAELTFLFLGLGLRVLVFCTHRPESGYDFGAHQTVIIWWTEHFRMPPLLLSRGAYHPQLYYVLAALIRRAGGGWRAVQAFSVYCGCFRLCLVCFASIRYLASRPARLLVLALAAVMPASVQLDAMVTQESLNNLLAVAFLVILMETCRASSQHRRPWTILLGLVSGLALLVKASGLVLLGVLLIAPLFELAQSVGLDRSERLARFRSWTVVIAITVALCGGQYVHNHVAYGKTFPDGWYQRPTEDTQRVGAQRIATLDRRTLGYLVAFSTDVVHFPYYPAGVEPNPRFWPVLIASSFCDYYNYYFAPAADVGSPVVANGRQVGERATLLARASVASGIVIAVICAAAWPASFVRFVRRREVARPLVLLIPALAVIGQLLFATEFPYDFEGVVKGVYFHFATLPLYALLGAVFAWLWGSRGLRFIAWALATLLVPVATYTTYCVIQR